jgi:hypothetical protein
VLVPLERGLDRVRAGGICEKLDLFHVPPRVDLCFVLHHHRQWCVLAVPSVWKAERAITDPSIDASARMPEWRIRADRVLVAVVCPKRALVLVEGQRETKGAIELNERRRRKSQAVPAVGRAREREEVRWRLAVGVRRASAAQQDDLDEREVEVLGVRVRGLGSAKLANFAKILQIFSGLVLGCIKTKFCKKIRVLQHFSKSTRLSC